MSKISTELVKELREETGISVMQCRKALEEAGGDKAKALEILKKKSKDIASKKADRTLKAGVISCYTHVTGKVGSMVELLCESDFVSGNEEFKALAYNIAMQVAATSPEFIKREDISAEAKLSAREVFLKDVEGKPENLKEKILEGKLNAYFSEKTLLEQPFIKNPENMVADLVTGAIQKFGEKVEISRFVRFNLA